MGSSALPSAANTATLSAVTAGSSRVRHGQPRRTRTRYDVYLLLLCLWPLLDLLHISSSFVLFSLAHEWVDAAGTADDDAGVQEIAGILNLVENDEGCTASTLPIVLSGECLRILCGPLLSVIIAHTIACVSYRAGTPEEFEEWRRGASRYLFWSLDQMLPSPSLRDLIVAYEQQYATNARLRTTMDAVIDFCVYADHADQPYSSEPLEAKVCCIACVFVLLPIGHQCAW